MSKKRNKKNYALSPQAEERAIKALFGVTSDMQWDDEPIDMTYVEPPRKRYSLRLFKNDN